MRIAFWGTPDVAVPSLTALVNATDIDVICVITNPDRPRGRSGTPAPSPVKSAALEHGLDVLQPDHPRTLIDTLIDMNLDACAVVAYGSILPPSLLATARNGFVNLHFSLLPRWRGAAPVQWAIRAGDTETGITTFVLDQGMDTGAILTQLAVPLGRDDTTQSVLHDLAERGAPELVHALRGLCAGTITPRPQPSDGATLAPKISRVDVALTFTKPAIVLDSLTRSADPQPGAHARFRGETVKVFRAVTVTDTTYDNAPCGTVVALSQDGPVIACGSGAVTLTELQLPGKPRRDGHSVANGLRIAVGEQFSDGISA
ncbi:MAG: methionyl-tRNA formyltransferase [Nitriliruptoraceae bacterium]